MAEQTEKEIEEEIKPEDFSFPPGSSVTAFEKNVNAPRRKAPKYGVYPTLTSEAAFPGSENDPAFGIRIGLSDQAFAERCHRKVCGCGTYRQPYVRLPPPWLESMGVDWKHKENGHDDLTLEISEDRQEIRIRKTPAPPTMQKNVHARIFEVDSDEGAALHELEQNQEK
jgi:hypothetical protein